ncbi:HD-GYP domain-containing protein [Geobacter sp.]|uniref:HD-GYP domain-containing protein n=1 Tax=Geobacter sp. TaxID=46610 RepID=UPI0027BA6D4B|nr:HD domain-containing phosphohydrolase [Geobacter sp.]
MEAELSTHKRNLRVAVLLLMLALVSLFHFLIPTEPHTLHKIHIILRKLYFLPPVVAAAWFGLRGAAVVTALISVAFVAHALLDWPGNYMEQANQLGELVGFWVVGLLPGWLFDRRRVLMESLARANEETLLALVSALDMREKNTRLHSQRVREYTLLLAARFGVKEKERRVLALGALLHDVGKIAVPDHILLKPSGLSEDEWREMRRHPGEGYRLLRRIGFLEAAAEIVHAHHEHYDGTGYPRGLRGEEIPLGARLFMVADVFDALTSERPYHRAIGYEEAARVIRGKRGSHFDPAVVTTFDAIRAEEWEEVRKRYTSPVEDSKAAS